LSPRSHWRARRGPSTRGGAAVRPSRAELATAEDFLAALAAARRVLDSTELRVEAVAAGIAQGALWAAVARRGGVPGWQSAAPWAERAL
jgi:hypothetical protein